MGNILEVGTELRSYWEGGGPQVALLGSSSRDIVSSVGGRPWIMEKKSLSHDKTLS